MASKHNRSRKPKNNAPVGPKLAYELFSELNATFYQDDPSEYLLVKIEAVTLMLAPAEALAPAYASERAIGVTRHAGMPVPSKQTRRPHVRTGAQRSAVDTPRPRARHRPAAAAARIGFPCPAR